MNDCKICVSVSAKTADRTITQIRRAAEWADLVEVRFDHLDPEEIEKTKSFIETSNLVDKVIATFRAREQGGMRELTANQRHDLWHRLQGPFFARDIEEDLIPVLNGASRTIVSHHDFKGEPNDLKELFTRLAGTTGTIVKIAVRANDIVDAIPVWKLIETSKRVGKPVIPIAMGEAGKWTRILGPAHGTFLTYCSLEAGSETADGQVTARDMTDVYRVRELGPETLVYGTVGHPISSSLSPYMQNPAFAQAGIDAVFLPLLVKDISAFMRRMVRTETREVELNFGGLSVTMPHKQTIARYLDVVDPTAARIGAINTVKIDGKVLTGCNTDAHGFISPLRARIGDVSGTRAAVFGAGGAARACIFALKDDGADVTVFARDAEKARILADEFGVASAMFDDVRPCDFDLIVNATPLGMKGPYENETPFTAEQLAGVGLVYDLVTKAIDTPLIREARLVNVATISGVEMLVAQGAKQFEIWTEEPAPIETMRTAVFDRMRVSTP